jgi:1-deoxy-D-xylulose-5-phosphate synthase
MLHTMAQYDAGPSAIRYPRGVINGTPIKPTPALLEIGKAEILADGTDIALIGLGTMSGMAQKTKALLEEKGHSVALINPRFIKPLDAAVLTEYGRKCKVLCTFEDHVLLNGFGASVIELLHDHGIHTPIERIGWPDEFIEHGKPDILMSLHGLTPEAAVTKILRHLP